jgi:hypothetical protein
MNTNMCRLFTCILTTMTNITSTNMGHQIHQENRTLISTLMFVFATSIPTSRTPTISIGTNE